MSAPNSISGLYCWLDAAYTPNITIDWRSKAVTSWVDRQSNFTFSGGYPQFQFDGQFSPGVQFRAGTYLSTGSFTVNLGAASTVIFVLSRASNGGGLMYKGPSGFNGTWANAYAKKWWLGDSGGANENGTGNYPCMVGNSENYVSSNQTITGDLDVIMYVNTGAYSGSTTIYMNGVAATGYSQTGFLNVTDSGNNCIIGGAGPNVSQAFFNGTMHEMIIYNTNISTTSIANLYTYFQQKWRSKFSYIPTSGSISMSQIGNELNSYTVSACLGKANGNPNRLPGSSASVNFSQFRGASRWAPQPTAPFLYRLKPNTSGNPWNPSNMSGWAQLAWLTSYESTIFPIVNYTFTTYNISQNTTGANQSGTMYIFQDDNANYYLNGTNFANPTYTGATNSYSQTQVIGKNLFQGSIYNGGGPGDFEYTWSLGNGTTAAFSGACLSNRFIFNGSIQDVVGKAYVTTNGTFSYTTGTVNTNALVFSGNSAQTTPQQWFWFPCTIDQPPFSISFWVYFTSGPIGYSTLCSISDGKGNIPSNWDYYNWGSGNAIGVYMDLPDQWTISGLGIGYGLSLNTWYHLCVTVDSTFVSRYYVNGVNQATQTGTGPFRISSTTFTWGGNGDGGGLTPNRNFNGYIDEFCIHYGALNSTQVSSMSNKAPYYSVSNQNASVWYADSDCQWDYYSWATACTYYHQGGYNAALEGSNPDYQWHLGNSTGSTLNHIYWNQRIQDYNNFTLYFEIWVGTGSGADGLFCYVGENNVQGGFIVWESNNNGGILLDFQLYTGNSLYSYRQGINFLDSSNTVRASYATSGFVASAWQPVYFYYNKSTTNTWSCTWNGTSVWTWSDPNLFSWIATSGPQWGFGFRDGGVAGTAYIRHVQLFHK